MNRAPGSPRHAWLTFEEMLPQFQSPDPWREPTGFEYNGFFQAAVEALAIEDRATLLAGQQSLAFDASLTIQYLGEGSSHAGYIFHAFLFRGRGFDAVIWIENGLRGARLTWRGDEDACVRAELLLRTFEGKVLAHWR